MVKECVYNHTVNIGFTIIFQVVFIFAFLTIFFFYYVVNIEKNEFQSQLNIIVDNILTQDTIKSIIPYGISNKLSPEQEAVIISGIIDTVIDKSIMDNTKQGAEVIEANNIIRKKAFVTLAIAVGSIILLTIVLLLLRFCIPIIYEIKEALWVVFFVGLTEFAFLMVIARNYISADPNHVRRIIGKSIEDWITKNIHI